MADPAPTPGQTVGPFFHYALPYPGDRELVRRGAPGSLWLHGYVYDGEGNPMPDALLEIRQADTTGVIPEIEGSMRRDGARFTGWGRSNTDPTGHYWFSTVEPAPTHPGAALPSGAALVGSTTAAHRSRPGRAPRAADAPRPGVRSMRAPV